MTDLDELIDTYCHGWSEPTEKGRERLIRDALSEDAAYCDPSVGWLTVPQLLDHIAQFRTTWPGVVVRRTSRVDSHHAVARFDWTVELPDGQVPGLGTDTVDLGADESRITRVVGFFGLLEERERGARQR